MAQRKRPRRTLINTSPRPKFRTTSVKPKRQTSSIIITVASLVTAAVASIASAVIAFGTIRYWKTTEAMLSQMELQGQQTQQALDEARATNETMRAAYDAATQSNRIIQSQLELQIVQNFYDKRQQHYDLKAQRDKIIHRETPEFKLVHSKLEANYEAMQELAKRYAPLGGKLAALEKELPPPKDLLPAAPMNVRFSKLSDK